MCAKINVNEMNKRMWNDYKRLVSTSSGTPQKVVVISPKGVRLKKSVYRARMINRADGVQNVQDSVKEEDVIYVIEHLEKAHKTLRDIRDESRKESKRIISVGGGGGGTPPNNDIFHRLVDEGKMASCILKIVDQLFHGEKECEICEIKFNVYEFFLLTQYYFDYIHILENRAQLAFCNYLKKKVFGGKDKVGVRNYNNYANSDVYTNFDKILRENKSIKFDKRPELPRPNTENRLLAPFQEIGWKFRHSEYFGELRKEREKVQTFEL